MQSILKALGVTIWGLVGFGLVIVLVVVGYRTALNHRIVENSVVDRRKIDSGAGAQSNVPSGSPADLHIHEEDMIRLSLLLSASQHQYELAQEYGTKLYDSGTATPDDLLLIAQTYYSIRDCEKVGLWIDRASRAFHAAARDPDRALNTMKDDCAAEINKRPVTSGMGEYERMERLLKSLKERAETDRKNLPEFELKAESSKLGELDVKLGEVYFGFGDYQSAIIAIQRGLKKGQVTHLDDAYVYLGLSEQAVNERHEARAAFARLKDVPNINPRVLKLWELYAETRF